MKALPDELWLKILSEAQHSDLLALTATCRFFRATTKPRLYKWIYLKIKRPLVICDGGIYFDKTVYLLVRSLTQNSELRSLVRALLVSCADLRDVTGRLMHWRNPILYNLPHFSGLQNLVLEFIGIEAMLLRALTMLPTLSSIEFRGCEIDPRLGLQAVSGIRAKEVTISFPRTTHGWAAIIPSDLQVLAIHIKDSVALTVLFADLLSRHQDNALTTFYLSECVPANLVPFLMTCPHLRCIILPDTYDDGDVLLPAAALPRLEIFSGAYDYSLSFIPARPLHTVSLTVDYSAPVEALKTLCRSSTPITALTLKFDCPGCPAALLRHAPVTLRRLELQREFDENMHWISGLERLLVLQTLIIYGDGDSLTRAQQEAVVQEVGETCGSVREVAFDWPDCTDVPGRTWRWQAEGRWECYVD